MSGALNKMDDCSARLFITPYWMAHLNGLAEKLTLAKSAKNTKDFREAG
jgi:hypothetical protein